MNKTKQKLCKIFDFSSTMYSNSFDRCLWFLFERMMRPHLKNSLYSAAIVGYDVEMHLDASEMQVCKKFTTMNFILL